MAPITVTYNVRSITILWPSRRRHSRNVPAYRRPASQHSPYPKSQCRCYPSLRIWEHIRLGPGPARLFLASSWNTTTSATVRPNAPHTACTVASRGRRRPLHRSASVFGSTRATAARCLRVHAFSTRARSIRSTFSDHQIADRRPVTAGRRHSERAIGPDRPARPDRPERARPDGRTPTCACGRCTGPARQPSGRRVARTPVAPAVPHPLRPP